MSWSIGFCRTWNRDIGYGVPAYCDHPGCFNRIDRGLAHVCEGGADYEGEGCGMHFCEEHRFAAGLCIRCDLTLSDNILLPVFRPKPDHPSWVHWKLTHPSWAKWRAEHPREVRRMKRLRPLTRKQRLRRIELARRAGWLIP